MAATSVQGTHDHPVCLHPLGVVGIARSGSPFVLNGQQQVELGFDAGGTKVRADVEQEGHHSFAFGDPGPGFAGVCGLEANRAGAAAPHTHERFQDFTVGAGELDHRPDVVLTAAVEERRGAFAFKQAGCPGQVFGRPHRTGGEPGCGLSTPHGQDLRAVAEVAVVDALAALPLSVLGPDVGVRLVECVPVAAGRRDDASTSHPQRIPPFLAHILLADGTTVYDQVAPRLALAYERGEVPALLPGASS